MNQLSPLNVVEILITTGLLIGSTILYGVVPWWRTWGGRLFFGVLFNFTLIFVLVSFSAVFGHYEARALVRDIIYALSFISSVVVFVSILRAQIRGSLKLRKVNHEDVEDILR